MSVQATAAETETLTGYAELNRAFEIIRKIRKDTLRWQPNVLKGILYQGTLLERTHCRNGFTGENEVIMKNVYFLATKTKNISDALVLNLVDVDVLTTDEGNVIVSGLLHIM